MALTFRNITSKRVDKLMSATRAQKNALNFLRAFQADFVREMATYPPALPWKGRTPASGPRKGGRRTGTLGRNWSSRIRYTRNSVTIVNPTPYGVFVQGPRPGEPRRRQTDVMRARGWPNITTVSKRTYKKHKDKIKKGLR